ncbi:MAG: prephenate dehydrogenase [Planctomycetaceae bacterium]|nr:prephenate dehydrogenase [Planctomycetaceae bacterium]
MSRPTVAVVGLGQMGGSFAAALTRRRLARVVGVTRRAETAARARKMGILADAGTDLSAVSDADVVVLATPVRTLLRQIPEVAPLVRSGSILTDVGSTKTDVVEALRRAKPAATVVAGHPMAGNERAGLDGVDENLFEQRPWVLIGNRRRAALLERLVTAVGARPLWMKNPEEHDLKVARVSHIPYLLAYALMGTPEDSIRVCGNSFRDATRVAKSDPDMVLDFLLTNPRPIRRSAGELKKRLDDLLRAIARGEATTLRKTLERARERRSRI